MSAALRLRLDSAALVSNWRWLKGQGGGAACGAAVKADGYGAGARGVVARLAAAGCCDFFVATWNEAMALGPLPDNARVSVLHGVSGHDMPVAPGSMARPVLNTPEQVSRWRPTGRPCDVMIDTGMNRLGLTPGDDLSGLAIDTLMSHLACADQHHPMNAVQLAVFAKLDVAAKRRSLANSAGVCLGRDYAFDLTRPGLALYGGVPRAEAAGHIAQVVFPEAAIVQRRRVPTGETVGYGATWIAPRDSEIAILNIGYGDGIARALSNSGSAGGGRFPFTGRVSMDLVAIDVTREPTLKEGDWVAIDYDLPETAQRAGRSQYELLTGLGNRFERLWTH